VSESESFDGIDGVESVSGGGEEDDAARRRRRVSLRWQCACVEVREEGTRLGVVGEKKKWEVNAVEERRGREGEGDDMGTQAKAK
jgi:hypothetical protein